MNRTLDVVILVGLLGMLVLSGYLLSPAWGFFLTTLAAALGTWEIVSSVRTGRTLTQRFRKVLQDDPKKAWFFIISLVAFFSYLTFHLLVGKGG